MTVLDRRRFLQFGVAAALAPRARAATPLRVVVAGSGIIGASAALYLARAGADVTVIDRTGPATHASRGSFAWIMPAGRSSRSPTTRSTRLAWAAGGSCNAN
jgi:glycine/D-amino acid oxidase-like deaminating enzyme